MADRNTVIYGNQIKDATVTEDELNASVAGDGLTGGAGSPLAVNVDDSTVEIDTDAIRVKDDGITNAKLANITRGSVKVGGVADAPTDLVALTDKQILIGDGTDVVSVAVSGDVTIANDGVTTIGTGAVDNDMLAGSIADGKLASDYIQTSEVDDSSIEFGASLNVKALGITNAMLADDNILEAKLDATNAPTEGYFLTFDSGSGGFTWVESPATSGVQEADIKKDDFSATLNGVLTDFDLTEIPITASLQVFINGVLQQEGVGKDYQLNAGSGETKTIKILGDVLATGEKLIVHYIQDN